MPLNQAPKKRGGKRRLRQNARPRIHPLPMTAAELKRSVATDSAPPGGLSPELKALWLAKKDRWEEAHNIAQDIHTPDGSWIHALLHLIEGDTGNAGYWYARAGRATRSISEIDAEWDRIAAHLCGE